LWFVAGAAEIAVLRLQASCHGFTRKAAEIGNYTVEETTRGVSNHSINSSGRWAWIPPGIFPAGSTGFPREAVMYFI
jgi:hypothetical protein